MAQDFRINVGNNFSVKALADYVVKMTAEKGYSGDVFVQGDTTSVKVEKNTDTIYLLIGLVESVNVKLRVDNGVLSVKFTDIEYTSKIIAFVIGWFLLWFVWIPAIIGLVNQNNLNNDIAKYIRSYVQANVSSGQCAAEPQAFAAPVQPVEETPVKSAEDKAPAEDVFDHDDTDLDKTMGVY